MADTVHHLTAANLTSGRPIVGSPTLRSMSSAMANYPDILRQFDYLDLANQFYQAFCDLPGRPPPQSWPRYFMLCHAIELALKSYLIAHGATTQQLTQKTFRHSMTELITQAIDKGLSLTETTRDDIKRLHEAHEKYWHRYPKENAKPVFIIEQFEPAARELLDRVAATIHGMPHS